MALNLKIPIKMIQRQNRHHYQKISSAIIFLLMTLFYQSSIAEITLPSLGSTSDDIITPAEEKRIGKQIMLQLKISDTLVTDMEIQEYIQSLGKQIAYKSNSPNTHFTFFVINNKNINAFATVAGHVGIHTGLILITRTEGELASVLAHEITHVTQKHLLRQLDNSRKLSIPTIAGLMVAVLLGSISSDASQAALATTLAASNQARLNYTRSNEEEADRIGMNVLVKTGFNAHNMPDFFKKMQQNTRLYGGDKIPEYLRTHPLTLNRISESEDRATKHQTKQRIDSLEYHLIKAKLQIDKFDTHKNAINYFKNLLSNKKFYYRQSIEYGLGYAYMKSGKYPQAEKLFKNLSLQHPNQWQYQLAHHLASSKNKKTQLANSIITTAVKTYPDNNSIKYHYIKHLIALGRIQEAFDYTKNILPENQEKASIWYKLLAQSSHKLQQFSDEHYYLAQYYKVENDLSNALRQIDIALSNKKLTLYKTEKYDAFKKELKLKQRQLKKDNK